MKLGKLPQHLDHPVVVLQRMKTRPREEVAAGLRVAVLRLMHVPEHNEMDALHSVGFLKRRWRTWFEAVGMDRWKVNSQAPRITSRRAVPKAVCALNESGLRSASEACYTQ